MKLARPQHRSVHIVGDGGFYFGNLDSVFAVSREHRLPIFSIIVDNTGWNAVGKSSLGGLDVSDDGSAVYVMNLADNRLYIIPVLANGAVPAVTAMVGSCASTAWHFV